MNAIFKLAYLQTCSLWRAGALRVLVFALVLAVAAITAVSFFTQRIDTALNQQGSLLLGADLVLSANHVLADNFEQRATKLGLASVRSYEFPSMVMFGNSSQLVEIKAVGQGFPLRGDLTIGATTNEVGQVVKTAPKLGQVWVEPRLAHLLNLQVGSVVEVGERKFSVSAILLHEPSRGGDMFGFAPRLMMNAADLASTKLLQYGSRAKFQLLLAASPEKVNQYFKLTQPELTHGEKIQDLRNARPEIKLALEKAQQFLGLSAMVSVILAMVAMLLSSMPYIKQSLDSFALMRCFGASQNKVMQLLAIQTLLIAFFSALIGITLGFIAQLGLAQLAASLFVEALPPASLMPMLVGMIASLAMMFAVVLPHAWQMQHISTMNILRRETLMQPLSVQLKFLPAALTMSAMLFWQAQDFKIALATIGVILLLCLLVIVCAYGFVSLTARLLTLSPQNHTLNAVKLGVLGLKRRFVISTIQMIGFSMGLMVLILLALIRGDLINNWQASLPVDAPNRFVINIQPSQIDGIHQFFAHQHIKNAAVFPMVKARFISKNGMRVKPEDFNDERARHLAEREFNLSWAMKMQSDNQLQSGHWWNASDEGKPYISLEQDLAKTLGIKLGDQLEFEIAGSPITLTVTSLRKVEWDSMRVNFFAVTPPGVLEHFNANYISSFHLPFQVDGPLNLLLRQYPNLTIIDVAALMQQIRGIMQKMSSTVQYVFAFSLIAGSAVLYAALVATHEERILDATLLRVFGASRRQVAIAYVAEFSCIGLVAALVAVIAANLLAYYMSAHIFNIPFTFNFSLALLALLISAAIIPFAAWLGLRRFLNIPPRQLLNSI